MPEQDAVVAITSGVKDMQAVLNVIWDKLLPAMQPKKLKADTAASKHNLAQLYRARGKYAQAEELYWQLHQHRLGK